MEHFFNAMTNVFQALGGAVGSIIAILGGSCFLCLKLGNQLGHAGNACIGANNATGGILFILLFLLLFFIIIFFIW